MISGKILSQGIGIGQVQKLESFIYNHIEKRIELTECAQEVDKFISARALTSEQLKKLQNKAEKEWGEEKAEVFAGHLEIVLDNELHNEVVGLINTGITADSAVYQIFEPQIAAVKNKKDEYLAARAVDLQDIRDRFLKNILLKFTEEHEDSVAAKIICVEDLTPSQTAQLDLKRVKGIIVNTGGLSSHAAIMARTLGLPLILVKEPIDTFNNNETFVVDCISGMVLKNPEEAVVEQYQQKLAAIKIHKEHLKMFKDKLAVTTDGKEIRLFANIGSDDDIPQALEHGALGIGLFRTEFLFMGKISAPSEELQFRVYKKLAEAMGDKPVIIRTFDFGGDKKIPYLNLPKEENPFLGQRSVRLYEKRFDLFATQLRAIVKAAAFGNLKIMYPLISSVTELKKIAALADKAVATLPIEDQKNYHQMGKGLMVETPSCVLLADHLIKYCDFFSIGSNDLTQYSLAVDRGNTELLDLFDTFNPAILRLINMTIKASHKAGKWTGICGEFASDINGALILVGMGVDELSMSASFIPQIKSIICQVSYQDLQKSASEVLNFETSEEITSHINKFKEMHNV